MRHHPWVSTTNPSPGLPSPLVSFHRPPGKGRWRWHWLQQNPDSCLPEPTDLTLVIPRAAIGTQSSLQEGCGRGGKGCSHSEHGQGLELLLLEKTLGCAPHPCSPGRCGMSAVWAPSGDSRWAPRGEALEWRRSWLPARAPAVPPPCPTQVGVQVCLSGRGSLHPSQTTPRLWAPR